MPLIRRAEIDFMPNVRLPVFGFLVGYLPYQ